MKITSMRGYLDSQYTCVKCGCTVCVPSMMVLSPVQKLALSRQLCRDCLPPNAGVVKQL